jgi:threonylcarbamoyladenosine tRNA methylthiotransferase MtaB
MRRKYDAPSVEQALEAIASKVPGAFVGMDVIAGFPGETEEEFADTYERLARLPWTRLHVFPYSERPGTKAVALEDSVPREVRIRRSQRLRTLSSERLARAAAEQIGSSKKVMLLKSGVDGLSRDYWPVRLNTASLTSDDIHGLVEKVGTEVEVKITGFDESETSRMDGVLLGEVMA